jgi:DNA-binding NarL/FixJ family response regulator
MDNEQFMVNMPTEQTKGNHCELYNNCIFSLDAITSLCVESICIIDFKKRRFHYVSDHGLFLCGHSREEVMELGYDFYSKTVHPDDMQLFNNMYHIINSYIIEHHDDVHYFSFTARIKNHPQINASEYLYVYHKLKPVLVNGNLSFGICALTLSTISNSKNLRAFFNFSAYFDEYSFTTEKWERQSKRCLTEREREIIKLSAQGYCNKLINGILYTSYEVVRHSITNLLKTFNIKSMKEVIVYATDHLMLFGNVSHEDDENSANFQLSRKDKEKKRKEQDKKRKLTGEKLHNIQIRLNNGQSVNSIANDENVSRGSIRHAVNSGKITKPNDKKT